MSTFDTPLADDGSDEGSGEGHSVEFTLNPDVPRILVVADEKVIREILVDFLSVEGYLVRSCEDGALALKELERRSYNLVISDMKMPNLGGLELIERITQQQI